MKTKTRTEMIKDPIIDEVRKAGEEIAREANYDLHVLCERLKKAERRNLKRYHCDKKQGRKGSPSSINTIKRNIDISK